MSDWGVFGIILAVMGVFVVIWIVVGIFYCLTLQKALNRCAPQNRAMSPGLVWLFLIPIFNLVWHFFIVLNMAKSLQAEFAARNMIEEQNPGQGIGLAACILNVASWVPYVGGLAGLAGFICWIVYWVKIAGFSSKIAEPYQPTTPPVGTAPAA